MEPGPAAAGAPAGGPLAGSGTARRRQPAAHGPRMGQRTPRTVTDVRRAALGRVRRAVRIGRRRPADRGGQRAGPQAGQGRLLPRRGHDRAVREPDAVVPDARPPARGGAAPRAVRSPRDADVRTADLLLARPAPALTRPRRRRGRRPGRLAGPGPRPPREDLGAARGGQVRRPGQRRPGRHRARDRPAGVRAPRPGPARGRRAADVLRAQGSRAPGAGRRPLLAMGRRSRIARRRRQRDRNPARARPGARSPP
jgi:hypothetical protein